MRLGEVLVHTGVINAEQLDAGLRQQVVYGGRLGTNLIELGYASQDQIAQGLSRLHHVPAALSRHLSQHDNAVLETLPASLAAQCAAFPVAYSMSSGRRLVVCMRDPHMPEATAAMARVAQMQVVACVAPELAVYYWLERCYKIPRARRFAYAEPGQTSPLPRSASDQMPAVEPLLDDDDIDIDVDEEEDMADMLQLVDLDHSQVSRDHTQYRADTKAGLSGLDMVERRPGTDTSPAPKYTLRGPTPTTTAPVATAATAATAIGVTPAATAVGGPATITDSPPAPDPKPAPAPAPLPTLITPPPPPKVIPKMTLGEAEAAIADADERDEVMKAVIAYMHGMFGGGLILIVKDELALGLRGFGGSFDESSVETIVLPLSAQSFFKTAYDSKTLFHGKPEDGHLQERFFKLFGGDVPVEVLVVPVVLRDRVVCMFYGHGRRLKAMGDRQVAELSKLAHKTEAAFVELIRGKKKKTD